MGMGLIFFQTFFDFSIEIFSHSSPVQFLKEEMAFMVTASLNLDCNIPRCSTVTGHHFEGLCMCVECFLFDGITLTNYKRRSWLCFIATSDIMKLQSLLLVAILKVCVCALYISFSMGLTRTYYNTDSGLALQRPVK